MRTDMEKARQILMKYGWFNDFYYILKVMEGNRKSTNVRHELVTRKWGTETLERKKDFILKKHPEYSILINNIFYEYYNIIHEKHDSIIDDILSNARGNISGDKEEIEETKKHIGRLIKEVIENK